VQEDIFTTIARRIERFFAQHLKTILILVGAVVVIAAVYFSIQSIITGKEKAAESAFGRVYLTYSNTVNDQSLDEDQMREKLMELTESLKVVIEDYPSSGAASRSAYYIGNILYKYAQYEEALVYYGQGANIKPNSYSAPLCIQGEASCYEQLEDYEKAEERYTLIIEKYGDSFLIPMVRFSLGQLYEMQEDVAAARDQYDILVSDYSWSSWSDLAEKKILILKNT
jgi:tetratricopeptide (TPR) repeat protein